MNERRWATKAALWLLGGWLFVSVAMAYVAGANFIELKPENLRNADEVFAEIPAGEERMRALRYIASELNRTFFATYSVFQEVLGALAFLLLLASRRGRWVGVVLTAAAFLTTVWFDLATAEIIEMGRGIDFDRDPDAVAAFRRFHDRVVRVEGGKMIAILVTSGLLMKSARTGQPS